MLAVVDTNVWISAVLTRNGVSAAVPKAIGDSGFVPVMCPGTRAELNRIAGSERLLRKYPHLPAEFLILVERLDSDAIEVADPPIIPICRDPRDDIFIALAVASKAEYLVTGDGDLKDDAGVVEYLAATRTKVVTVREFLGILEPQR